jgi:hypothetical protein
LDEIDARCRAFNIYRLIKLGLFPAPIHLGGSKWVASEVEEYIQRRKDDRDSERGENKFAPRPRIMSAQGSGDLNGSLPGGKTGIPANQSPSTVRVLSPELCSALRMLKIDVPELYLDPKHWTVSLAVIKVELSSGPSANNKIRGKNRRSH